MKIPQSMRDFHGKDRHILTPTVCPFTKWNAGVRVERATGPCGRATSPAAGRTVRSRNSLVSVRPARRQVAAANGQAVPPKPNGIVWSLLRNKSAALHPSRKGRQGRKGFDKNFFATFAAFA
jgi:hypothetical protein